jgi:hypothetical protein
MHPSSKPRRQHCNPAAWPASEEQTGWQGRVLSGSMTKVFPGFQVSAGRHWRTHRGAAGGSYRTTNKRPAPVAAVAWCQGACMDGPGEISGAWRRRREGLSFFSSVKDALRVSVLPGAAKRRLGAEHGTSNCAAAGRALIGRTRRGKTRDTCRKHDSGRAIASYTFFFDVPSSVERRGLNPTKAERLFPRGASTSVAVQEDRRHHWEGERGVGLIKTASLGWLAALSFREAKPDPAGCYSLKAAIRCHCPTSIGKRSHKSS